MPLACPPHFSPPRPHLDLKEQFAFGAMCKLVTVDLPSCKRVQPLLRQRGTLRTRDQCPPRDFFQKESETGSKMPYLTLLSHKNLKREKLVVATKVLQINYIHLKYPKREVCSLCCALFWFMRHAICELAWFRAVRWLQIQYKCAGYARQHSEPTFSIFLCLNQTHTFFLIPVSTSLYAHTSYFFP